MTYAPVDRRRVLALTTSALLAPGLLRATPAPIPFQLLGGKIYLPMTIAGRTIHAILDSGSAFNGLDAAFAARAGIRPSGFAVGVLGIQGRAEGRWAKTVAFSVGGRSLSSRMLVLDYGSLSATIQHPVEALLGAEFMAAFVVEIDFEGALVTLYDRAGFASPKGAAMIPLSPLRGVVTAPVSVEGARLQAIVDTGSDIPIIVSPGPAARHRLLQGRAVSTTVTGGVAGTTVGQVTTLSRLAFGPAAFEGVPMQVPARSIGADANLGLGVLARYRLWLDFSGRRMWLARNGDKSAFKRDALGVYGAADGDGIRISHVAKGSPAARSGVVAGDVITRINGQPAAVANRLLIDAAAGTRLVLTMASGQVRTVVMASYY